MQDVLVIKSVSKKYGKFYAIRDVSLSVRASEVHVLFGENGAGKSTLIKVISGVISPDQGSVEIAGSLVRHFSPQHARALGVSSVFQEFSLAPDLTVEENLFLGRERNKLVFLDEAGMRREAKNLLDNLDFALPMKRKVGKLSRAQQQMTEIAKALLQEIKVIILDEPTASLTEIETRTLFKLIATLKARGVAIIYVSHRMKEIKQIADRITVMRNGQVVKTVDADAIDEDRLIELMIGRRLEALFPKIPYAPQQTVMTLEDVSTFDGLVRNVSIQVRAGEVVGIAGLVGSGNSDLLRAIFGLKGRLKGRLILRNRDVGSPTPRTQLRNGVCYFPSDRVQEGLALARSVQENLTVSLLGEKEYSRLGFLRLRQIKQASSAGVRALDVRPLNDAVAVGSLSGGNRQKVMLARGVVRKSHVYLFDEPTVGIDVSAKAQIYELVKSIIEEGGAVVLVSSELLEMVNLAHRVYVMSDGEIKAELQQNDISEAAILNGFFKNNAPEVVISQ
jgi:ribose transport system ATP-binding protein